MKEVELRVSQRELHRMHVVRLTIEGRENVGQDRRLLLRGSFILSATYTNPYTRRSYSLLSIPRVIEVGTKSVCG